MLNLGLPELILIFIVALIVFGPKRLPELGKSLGRAMHEFKRATNEFKDKMETEVGTSQIREELEKHQQEVRTSLAKHTEELYASAAAEKPAAPKPEEKPEPKPATEDHV